MNVLVVGNTCTGKSALINKMIGKDVAEEAEDEQSKGTVRVNVYDFRSVEGGVAGKFWDTPGLQDGADDDVESHDAECIRDMKEKGYGDKADLVLYCIKMSNTRFQEEDHRTIMNLSEGLGKGIWEKAIFVLTFANDVVARLERKNKHRPGKKPVPEIFKDVVSTWEEVLRKEIKRAGVNNSVAESIPVVPAGYEVSESFCPTDDSAKLNWIESLWCECNARKPQQWSVTQSLRKLFSRGRGDVDGGSSARVHDEETLSSQARHPSDPGQKSRSMVTKSRAQGVSSLKLKQEVER
jgi:GTPase SAR1 family protein